jgi:hypothetical protein
VPFLAKRRAHGRMLAAMNVHVLNITRCLSLAYIRQLNLDESADVAEQPKV